MANWTDNKMTIKGGNVGTIIDIVKKNNNVFNSECFLKTPEELLNELLNSNDLIEKYGFDNEYDWRESNLGVDCDFETEIDPIFLKDEMICYFQTAWDAPIEFCQYLSKEYQCEIEIVYLGEADFSGKVILDNGNKIFHTVAPWRSEYGIEIFGEDYYNEIDEEDFNDIEYKKYCDKADKEFQQSKNFSNYYYQYYQECKKNNIVAETFEYVLFSMVKDVIGDIK